MATIVLRESQFGQSGDGLFLYCQRIAVNASNAATLMMQADVSSHQVEKNCCRRRLSPRGASDEENCDSRLILAVGAFFGGISLAMVVLTSAMSGLSSCDSWKCEWPS